MGGLVGSFCRLSRPRANRTALPPRVLVGEMLTPSPPSPLEGPLPLPHPPLQTLPVSMSSMEPSPLDVPWRTQ